MGPQAYGHRTASTWPKASSRRPTMAFSSPSTTGRTTTKTAADLRREGDSNPRSLATQGFSRASSVVAGVGWERPHWGFRPVFSAELARRGWHWLEIMAFVEVRALGPSLGSGIVVGRSHYSAPLAFRSGSH